VTSPASLTTPTPPAEAPQHRTSTTGGEGIGAGTATATQRTSHGEGPDLLTVTDVMARLQLSRHTVYQLIRSKQLVSVRIGRCRRIPTTAVTDYVNNLTREATQHGVQETRQR
jgi:excisionase family DNA binding protein